MNSLFAVVACAARARRLRAPPSPMLEPGVERAGGVERSRRRRARAAVSADWWQRVRLAGAAARSSTRRSRGSPDLAIATERVRQAEAQVRIAGASLFPSLNLGCGTSRADAAQRRRRATRAKRRSATLERELRARPVGPQSPPACARREASLRGDALRPRDGAAHADRRRRHRLFRGAVAARAPRDRAREPRHRRARAGRWWRRARATAPPRRSTSRARRPAVLSQRAALLPLEQQERQTLAALAMLLGPRAAGLRRRRRAALADLAVPRSIPGCRPSSSCAGPTSPAPKRSSPPRTPTSPPRAPRCCPASSSPASAGVASGALLAVLSGPTRERCARRLARCSRSSTAGACAGRWRSPSRASASSSKRYRKAILAAFADVESALAAASRLAQQEALQAQVQAQAREALRLAEVRYREGADDLLIGARCAAHAVRRAGPARADPRWSGCRPRSGCTRRSAAAGIMGSDPIIR